MISLCRCHIPESLLCDMGILQLFQDCGAIIREIAGRVKRILDMPAMFVWYFKEENLRQQKASAQAGAFLRLEGEDENRAAVRRPQAISPAGCCLARGRIGIDQNGHACSAITHRKAFAVRKSASLKCPPLFHSRVQSAPRSTSRLCRARI